MPSSKYQVKIKCEDGFEVTPGTKEQTFTCLDVSFDWDPQPPGPLKCAGNRLYLSLLWKSHKDKRVGSVVKKYILGSVPIINKSDLG